MAKLYQTKHLLNIHKHVDCGWFWDKYSACPLIQKYEDFYQNRKALARHAAQIHQLVLNCCQKYQLIPFIPRPISFYPGKLQINKKLAGQFYLEARELQLSGKGDYQEWALRKAAWSLDDLEESIQEIYQNQGGKGIIQIKNIGQALAKEIEEFLNTDGPK